MDFLMNVKIRIFYWLWHIPWAKLALSLISILLSFLLQKFFMKTILHFAGTSLGSESKTAIKKRLIKDLESPVRLLIIISGIWIAVLIMNFPFEIVILLNKFFRTIIAFTVFKTAYKLVDILVMLIVSIGAKSEGNMDEILVHFIRKTAKVAIIVVGGVSIVQEWYKNIGGLLAGLGLGGLAFALAARDTVANLFGSITIMVDRPFKIGDFITTPYAEGAVEEIGFRSTRVRTPSQAVVTIPNSIMSNSAITNWSRMKKRRIEIRLMLKCSDSKQIKEFVNYFREALMNHPEICKEDITVCLEEVKDNVNVVLLNFFADAIQKHKYFELKEQINMKIIEKLRDMEIEQDNLV